MKRKIQKRCLLNQPLTAEEIYTLEQLSKHHRYSDFRRRALRLLALNEGRSLVEICTFLRISDQPVYDWARGWREKGMVGILSGHKGGAPVKLTGEMLDLAGEMARQELLNLGKIAAQVAERYPEALTFSLDRLSLALKAGGLSFKRNRLSLKKTRRTAFPASSGNYDLDPTPCLGPRNRIALLRLGGILLPTECPAQLVAPGTPPYRRCQFPPQAGQRHGRPRLLCPGTTVLRGRRSHCSARGGHPLS